MTDSNQQLMDDFIHQRGAFSETAIENYVHPDDLRSVRFHHSAGCESLELAKKEESKIEWERLMQKVRYHSHQTGLLLRKYNC
jgi:hypothetical protein